MGVNALQSSAPFFTPPPTDDLVEVEKLVVEVKERTSNVQALSHGTVGQYLPVGSIRRAKRFNKHAWQDPGGWRSWDSLDHQPLGLHSHCK